MATKSETTIQISPPKFERIRLRLAGQSPLMVHRFWKKAQIMKDQAEGKTARSVKKREPRDYEREFQESLYVSGQGWYGFPASAFRNAAISACRLVGFKMTLAKLSIFIEADGFDKNDKVPLIRIHGEPEMHIASVKNATGVVDIRSRAIFPEWHAFITVRFDAEQFKLQDVVNLISRVGLQVGIGEGRHDSKSSAGMGFGEFIVDASGE